MRYDVVFILLNFFVSIADFLPTTENECKRYANEKDRGERLEKARIQNALKSYLACRHDVWSRSNANNTKFQFMMRPKSISFDEESGKLDLYGWVSLFASEKRLRWSRARFPHFSTTFKQPDIAFMNTGTDDIYEREANSTECYLFWDGDISCSSNMHQTIRCDSDLTFWPYDRYTCTMIITSWFFMADELIAFNENPIDMFFFKSDGQWDFSFSRITNEKRKSFFDDNVKYPEIRIEFFLDRLHDRLVRRFVVPAVIMMVMTLTSLWLDPKSYECLAVASSNIVIHMMCIQDLHWVLPRNGIILPNILIFYINSLIFATMVLLLTFVLRKIKDTKTSAPKWISSTIDRLLKSKAGNILQLVMFDPIVIAGIETHADDTIGLSSSEPKKITWKCIAIFVGWISFFSLFSAYILMYIFLIPGSASRPPIMNDGPREWV